MLAPLLGLVFAAPVCAQPESARPSPAPAAAPLVITGITPSGENVPAGRQIVVQFDRPVVPIGRMERSAAEIPIDIEPPLDCQWRWLDTSALACQLGEQQRFKLATHYTITVRSGIKAEDGATTAGVRRAEFTTQRPRVSFVGFDTWRGPGTPVMRAVFTQPVTESSVREHLFVRAAGSDRRVAVKVEPDPNQRKLPRFLRLPGEQAFIDFGAEQTESPDARRTVLGSEEARRVWLVSPAQALPGDAHAELAVEPGLVGVEGNETGDERRVVAAFDTFPEFRFLGVRCRPLESDETILIAPGNADAANACNPLAGIGLAFSAPVIAGEIEQHVEILPDLAGGRSDYDPWANRRDYSRLGQPHRRGQIYTVWLPVALKAAESYRLHVPSPSSGPRDELGRTLAAPLDFEFATGHRPPSYTLAHPQAVLESGIDSDVPLYVTNLESYSLRYRTLTAAGRRLASPRTVALPPVEDVQYGVPLGIRALLAGASGALYGELLTNPEPRNEREPQGLFAAVTPFEVHVKLGHFNTLVWVTELATGKPVPSADVSIYVDRLAELAGSAPPLATAETDDDGIALLAGTQTLDPELALLRYGCGGPDIDRCPRLFVRVERGGELALLPLDYRFQVDSYRASNYTVFENERPWLEHLQAWGTTAQGVYRAGDTIDYKIYVRDQNNETYVPAPAGPYTLELLDSTGQTVQKLDGLKLSRFGALDGSYEIPRNAPVGWYQFKLTIVPAAVDEGRAGGASNASDADGDTGTTSAAGKAASGAGASSRVASDDREAAASGADRNPGSRRTTPARQVVRLPMRVLVSDFTPSSFGVATSLNGDLFEAGENVTADVRATLFSGGPYVDAEARITATITPRHFSSADPVAAPFRFDTGMAPRQVRVAQETGGVDAAGELEHTFRLPPDLGKTVVYGTLSVEGAVRDDRGRYVASAASADFVAVDRLVGLKPKQWLFRQGEPAEVQYLVVDAHGVPAPGTEVHIDIRRLETKAARVRGAGNAYLTQFIDEWVEAGSCSGLSTETPSTCRFVPDAPGSYRLTATIADTQGRAHTTVLDTWVSGQGQIVWHDRNDNALEIVPEKAAYQIGDTARYLVQNPYPGARALVTIERYGVLKSWVETLEGSTPVIEFKVEKDFMPGFYLSVVVMSPRVAAPPPKAGEIDLGKPAFRMGYVAVPVADPYKRIDVDVATDKAVYRPGETVHLSIAAAPRERDRDEPIEVAVAVLDEAVLDLVQGGTRYFDPYQGFFGLDGLDVRNFGLLTRLVGRQKIELKGANPGGDGGATFSMRSSFKYVSYWNPSVELDRRGGAELDFKVPDNLTGWRVLVLAATPTDRLGLGEGRFRVNLPTEIRPAMPNQVTEGDRFDAAFTVMNRTDRRRDIHVSITASGDVASPVSREETVALEAYARTTVALPVEAARVAADRNTPAGRIDFAVTASDGGDGDALRHTLPVEKRRALETAADYGSLDAAAATESLRFPERIRPDAGSVGIVLSPSVIGHLDGAFRYVRDYPYDDWEQKLAKGVMASHFARLRGYLPADLDWPGSDSLPDRALAEAASFQAPNGGMAYFVPRDEYASPYLSAYTALAFGWLREEGHAIPAAVERKLLAYLSAFLERDTAPDFYTRGMAATVRAVALAALAERGSLTLADLERYRPYVEYMSLFGKAHYLQAALAVDGGQEIAREVEESLLQSANRSGGKIAFNEVLDDGYLRITATPLNSSCAILSALSRGGLGGDPARPAGNSPIGPGGDVPFELVRAITAARGASDHWENTQENVFCTQAVLDYAARFESAPPDMRVAVDLGGEALGSAQFTSPRDAAVTLARPLGPEDAGAVRQLKIARSGTGRLYYSARMTYASTDEAAEAVNAGVDLHREYSVQRDGRWVLLKSPVTLRRGELVRVDLYVSLPAARNFLVVDDPVPGGLEPVNRDLANASLVDAGEGRFQAAGGAWWFHYSDWRNYGESRWSFYHEELRHDAARFYSEYLPPGHYHLSYTAQAIATGEFASQPARAVEMYDPDVYGLTPPAVLRVEDAP